MVLPHDALPRPRQHPQLLVTKLVCAMLANGRFPFWLSSPPCPPSLRAGAFLSVRDKMESPDARRAGKTGRPGRGDVFPVSMTEIEGPTSVD